MDLSNEGWGFFGILAAQVAGVVGLYMKLHKTDGKVDEAKETATEARELSRPTSNGFANEMREFRKEVRDEFRALRREIAINHTAFTTHLQDHSRVGLYVPRQTPRSPIQVEGPQEDEKEAQEPT